MCLKFKSVGIVFSIGLLILQLMLFTPVFAQNNPSRTQNLDEIRGNGFRYLQAGNWEAAQSVFENALQIAPKDSLSLYGSALALFNLKRFSEANENLNSVVQNLPENKENAGLLADSLVLSAVISAVNSENTNAIEKLEKAIKLAPKHFDANLSLGRAYFGNGDIDKAAYYFRKSVAIKPDDIRARFFLATALERLDNAQEALAEYRKVLELNPNSADGNLGLGVLLIKTQGEKNEEGLAALQKAVKINPNLYEAQIVLGKTLIRLNRSAEAIEPLQKAAQLAPNNPEPHFQLAIAYRKLGKKSEAEVENGIVKKIHESRRGANKPF